MKTFFTVFGLLISTSAFPAGFKCAEKVQILQDVPSIDFVLTSIRKMLLGDVSELSESVKIVRVYDDPKPSSTWGMSLIGQTRSPYDVADYLQSKGVAYIMVHYENLNQIYLLPRLTTAGNRFALEVHRQTEVFADSAKVVQVSLKFDEGIQKNMNGYEVGWKEFEKGQFASAISDSKVSARAPTARTMLPTRLCYFR